MSTKDEVLRAMADSDDDQLGIERIRQMLRAADALGWQLAPKEASEEMCEALRITPLLRAQWDENAQAAWTAMLSASPSLIEE